MKYPNGLYVAVQFSPESIEKIKSMIDELGVTNPIVPDELHTTVLYSKTPVGEFDFLTSKQTPLDRPYTVFPIEFDVFDTEEGNKCLVLLIFSPRLFLMHHSIKHLTSSEPTHPSYRPHITLSYDCPNADEFKMKDPMDYINALDIISVSANDREDDWADDKTDDSAA